MRAAIAANCDIEHTAPAPEQHRLAASVHAFDGFMRTMSPRMAEQTFLLLFLAALLDACHIDAVAELRRVLDKRTRRALRAEARLAALLEAEDERRRKREEPGLSAKERELRAARHKSNETHRKKLRLARADLARLVLVRKRVDGMVASAEAGLRRVGREHASHGKTALVAKDDC
jgi:hypothetical protein